MSAGTKSYTFRLPPELVAEMEAIIRSRNERTAEAPWTWSDFVRQCIQDKVDHRDRSKKAKAVAKERRANVRYTTTGGV